MRTLRRAAWLSIPLLLVGGCGPATSSSATPSEGPVVYTVDDILGFEFDDETWSSWMGVSSVGDVWQMEGFGVSWTRQSDFDPPECADIFTTSLLLHPDDTENGSDTLVDLGDFYTRDFGGWLRGYVRTFDSEEQAEEYAAWAVEVARQCVEGYSFYNLEWGMRITVDSVGVESTTTPGGTAMSVVTLRNWHIPDEEVDPSSPPYYITYHFAVIGNLVVLVTADAGDEDDVTTSAGGFIDAIVSHLKAASTARLEGEPLVFPEESTLALWSTDSSPYVLTDFAGIEVRLPEGIAYAMGWENDTAAEEAALSLAGENSPDSLNACGDLSMTLGFATEADVDKEETIVSLGVLDVPVGGESDLAHWIGVSVRVFESPAAAGDFMQAVEGAGRRCADGFRSDAEADGWDSPALEVEGVDVRTGSSNGGPWVIVEMTDLTIRSDDTITTVRSVQMSYWRYENIVVRIEGSEQAGWPNDYLPPTDEQRGEVYRQIVDQLPSPG